MNKVGRYIVVLIVVLCMFSVFAIELIHMQQSLDYCHSIGFDGVKPREQTLPSTYMCYKETEWNEKTGEYDIIYAQIPSGEIK